MSSCCILPESQALNKNFLLLLSHSYIILIKIILELQDDQLKTKQTFHLTPTSYDENPSYDRIFPIE